MKNTILTKEQFNEIIESRIEKIKATLYQKNKEYARNDKPLHNFYKAARIADTTPENALFGFMLKHYVSITDMVENSSDYSKELWQEKIGDMINYLILLEAMVTEEIELKNGGISNES